MAYIHEDNAVKQVNRSKWTIRDWRLAGLVHGVKRGDYWYYDEHGLQGALELMERNSLCQRRVPGPGRGNRWCRQTGIGLWDEDTAGGAS